MRIQVYDYLPEQGKAIRTRVFVEEQGFQNEFDETDDVSFHLVAYNDAQQPMATCRVYEGAETNAYILGRLAVDRAYRGMQLGATMVQEAEKLVSHKQGTWLSLHAQCRVQNFYEKQGYTVFGAIDEDEGCPHVWMRKQL